MKILGGVLVGLLMMAGATAQAAPTASFSAHRCTSAASPCAPPVYVHFDATATTSSISSDKPFVDLLFAWDFGDPDSGVWATDGHLKNRAFGGVAGHVFEKPGTYVVKLTVTDRTGAQSSVQRSVFIGDPNVIWPAAQTACVSASGDFAGCPTTGASLITNADACAAMGQASANNRKRILFRRGDRFTTGVCSTSGAVGTLYGAYGDPSAPRPRFDMIGTEGGAAIRMRANDVRVVDLDLQDTDTPMFGIEAFGVRQDALILRTRVKTRDTANLFFATNGPDGGVFPRADGAQATGVVYYLAIVDNELEGNTSTNTGGGGTCFYGGAVQNMFVGNRCGRGTAWQIRTIFNHKSVFQHNDVQANAGAFEAVKMHCAGGPGVICGFNVISDNVLRSERFNLTGGSAEDGNTINNSVFERNWLMNAGFSIEQPGNTFRHNVVRAFRIFPRANFAELSRGNVFENNTCNGGNVTTECIVILSGADAAGTVARNNLFYAGTHPNPTFSASFGLGSVDGVGNQIVRGTISPFAVSPQTKLSDFALKAGSPFINGGVSGARGIDLLGQPAPSGAAVDIGAVETQESGPEPDLDPPAAGAVASVQIVP